MISDAKIVEMARNLTRKEQLPWNGEWIFNSKKELVEFASLVAAAAAAKARADYEHEHRLHTVLLPTAGPQFAKVFQTERGQIVTMLHQDSDQSPAILLWFDAGIDGLALSSLALSFTDDAKARAAFDQIDQVGVERVVFAQIENIRAYFDTEAM